MDISIIINTRDRKKDLLECLDSVRKSDFSGLDFEIVIVDDFSSDGTENLNFSDLGLDKGKIIHNPSWQMMVRSRNIGIKNSTGKYVLFIDDDNIIDEKMIKTLYGSLEDNDRFGIVGPSMYYFDTKKKYMDGQRINLFTGKTTSIIDRTSRKLVYSDGIPNVFMIKREVFNKVGSFDESFIQTFTEPDFAFAARRYGWLCAVVKDAKTFHKISRRERFDPKSLGGNYIQKAYCLMRNRTLIVKRYGNFFQQIIYLLFFSWLWPMAYTSIVFRKLKFRQIRFYWRGWLDGMVYFFTGKLKNSLPKLLK